MTKDWTKLYKKHKGMWVALADDEETVLGFGNKLIDARAKAIKKGQNNPILMRVPDELTAYVGNF